MISSARSRRFLDIDDHVGCQLAQALQVHVRVPPTLGTRRRVSCGWTQNPVRPTSCRPGPVADQYSVSEGTSDTTRRPVMLGRGPPGASVHSSFGGLIIIMQVSQGSAVMGTCGTMATLSHRKASPSTTEEIMKIRVLKETKNHEYRVGLPRRRARGRRRAWRDRRVRRQGWASAPATPTTSRPAPSWSAALKPSSRAEMVVGREPLPPPNTPCSSPTTCCSPTRTWPPTPRWPTSCSNAGSLRSPTRPSPPPAAACRCWRRCRGAGRMSIHAGASAPRRNPAAGAACCSAACRAWSRAACWCWGRRYGEQQRGPHRGGHRRRRDGDRQIPGGAAPPGRDLRRRVQTLYATRDDIERLLMQADLVIGAVLPGATAPKTGHPGHAGR